MRFAPLQRNANLRRAMIFNCHCKERTRRSNLAFQRQLKIEIAAVEFIPKQSVGLAMTFWMGEPRGISRLARGIACLGSQYRGGFWRCLQNHFCVIPAKAGIHLAPQFVTQPGRAEKRSAFRLMSHGLFHHSAQYDCALLFLIDGNEI